MQLHYESINMAFKGLRTLPYKRVMAASCALFLEHTYRLYWFKSAQVDFEKKKKKYEIKHECPGFQSETQHQYTSHKSDHEYMIYVWITHLTVQHIHTYTCNLFICAGLPVFSVFCFLCALM